MSDIIVDLQHHLSGAFHSLFQVEIEPETIKLDKTRKEFEGDYTFVVFPYLKQTRMKPEDTAQVLGDHILQFDEVGSYNVIKGFLNINVSDGTWIDTLNALKDIEAYGRGRDKGKVMVEYSSPNTNKPLHLGHIRNNLLGYAVSNLLEHDGWEVVKANLVNDRGIHICKSMLAWQRFGNGETPESTGMKGDHFVGSFYVRFDKEYRTELQQLMSSGMTKEEAEKRSDLMKAAREMLLKWEQKDAQVFSLWEKMNSWVYDGFDVTYNRLGVEFDQMYYESETYLLGKDIVEQGLSDGVFFKKDDGSVWVDLEPDGLDEKLLLRADGTSVYMTQDIGTAEIKYNQHHTDKSVYVVGNEQDYHFKVLKLIAQKLGKPYADGIFHLSYGMVDLPEGKMKSREGTVVDADDLMDEMIDTAKQRTGELGKTEGMDSAELEGLYNTIGLGALKYYLLRVDAVKRMLFNPEESIDLQGNTATFIQYTYARCRSILRAGGVEERSFLGKVELNDLERSLIQLFYSFAERTSEAAESMSPSLICQYVYELAKTYNGFYNAHPILKETDENVRNLRLTLTMVSSQLIEKSLRLLGISVPERM